MNDDLISRQVAIDALVALANSDGAYGYIDAKEAEDTLNALPTAEPRWIPVTERLPGDRVNVLITYKMSGIIPGEFTAITINRLVDGEWTIVYSARVHKLGHVDVTAWMPLPKPWEGESDECTAEGDGPSE